MHNVAIGTQPVSGLPGIQQVAEVVRPSQMPAAIAKAIITAIPLVKGSGTTGQGEDRDTARQFSYATVGDVLDAAHEALTQAGVSAIPIEVSYSSEVVVLPTGAQIYAHYGYQFRLIHQDGANWVDEKDTRHISLLMPSDGKGAGKAQSLALRDYLKGLLRIRTIDPDEQQTAAEEAVKQPVKQERIPPKNAICFYFGTTQEFLSPKEIEDRFQKEIAPQIFAARKQWEGANATGLRELNERARPSWLRIQKVLEKE